MDNTTDDIIVNKVLAGETAAYSILVNRYRNMVFTLACSIITNREDAEELAQDSFVKAFKGLQSFKSESKFSTWLYRIVVNTALNKKKLRKFTTVDVQENIMSEKYDHIDPLLKKMDGVEQKKYIKLALTTLPDDERICITMYYLNELSVSEIHELTSISSTNIKVLLYRGRKHLYNKLEVLLRNEIRDLI